jgi:predicted outer membrane repeat protein
VGTNSNTQFATGFTNSGIIENSGPNTTTLTFAAGTLTNAVGGQIRALTTHLAIDGDLSNDGTVSILGAALRTLFVLGDFTQGSGGALELSIGDNSGCSPNDLLEITGAATFGGTLIISEGAGCSPVLGDSWTIATYASSTGIFVTGDDCLGSSGFKYNLTYGATDFVLDVVNADSSETNCSDGIDNDCDGETDCDVLECCVDPACGVAVSWVGGDGVWTNGSMWNTGTPPSRCDDVAISANGDYTVTVDEDIEARTIVVGGGAGTAILSCDAVTVSRSTDTGNFHTVAVGAEVHVADCTIDGVVVVYGKLRVDSGTSVVGRTTIKPGGELVFQPSDADAILYTVPPLTDGDLTSDGIIRAATPVVAGASELYVEGDLELVDLSQIVTETGGSLLMSADKVDVGDVSVQAQAPWSVQTATVNWNNTVAVSMQSCLTVAADEVHLVGSGGIDGPVAFEDGPGGSAQILLHVDYQVPSSAFWNLAGDITIERDDPANSWTLENTGDLTVDGDAVDTGITLVNDGTLHVESGTFSVAEDFEQTAAGTVILEATGTAPGGYGTLDVGGNATLDGALEVDEVAFSPTNGDALDVLSYGGGLSGTLTTECEWGIDHALNPVRATYILEAKETSCGDGVDNDCNGDIDCLDSLCPLLLVETGLCTGGYDDDCDGLTDCADRDCLVLFVDASAAGSANGADWANAFLTLTEALGAVSGGDCAIEEIWIAKGTYLPDPSGLADSREATFAIPSDVALYGGFPTGGGDGTFDARNTFVHRTVLSGDLDNDDVAGIEQAMPCLLLSTLPGCSAYDTDGNGTIQPSELGTTENVYHVITASGATGVTLDGVTVTAGWANAPGMGHDEGGGLHVEGPGDVALSDCTITGNVAAHGGGVYSNDADVHVSSCRFRLNSANLSGGAMYGEGGTLAIAESVFFKNFGQGGGALRLKPDTTLTMFNSRLLGNRASTTIGGGVRGEFSDMLFMNCEFSGNGAASDGGAIYSDTGPSSVFVYNTTLSRNTTDVGTVSGIECGTGVSCYVRNSILWGTDPMGGPNLALSTAANVAHCCIHAVAMYSGAGLIGSHPEFLSSVGDDGNAGTVDDNLRLRSISPCIDVGDDTQVPADALDVDGNGNSTEDTPLDLAGQQRVLGVVDMGAYERIADTATVLNGDEVVLDPGGTGCDPAVDCVPTADALVLLDNSCGMPVDCEVVETNGGVHDHSGGFAALDSTLLIDVFAADGCFQMTVTIPFSADDLAVGDDPLVDIDLTYYDTSSGTWKLAVCGNVTAGTACDGSGIGLQTRHAEAIEVSLDTLGGRGVGEYGVYWDSTSGSGFIWANVDHTTDFAAAVRTDEPCAVSSTCADTTADGVRDDNCVWWECAASICEDTLLTQFADMGGAFGACPPDGFANIHDKNHALSCFSGTNTCDSINIDAGSAFGTCPPDGFCNIHDANHALAAFAGTSTCSCPVGPMPEMEPDIAGSANLWLSANKGSARPGEEIKVHVFVSRGDATLRGYQLELLPSGGTSGRMELIAIEIDRRKDWVFAGSQNVFDAFNISTGRMLAGLEQNEGFNANQAAYLATFTYRGSTDAAGSFLIDITSQNRGQTYLVAPSDGEIQFGPSKPAIIAVSGRK